MRITDDNEHIFNGFYRGLVVENEDPLNSQRVRVRVLGIHSKNKDGTVGDYIPDDKLPWAEQAEELVEGCYIPKVNQYVWIFFENGNHNKPVYFAKCRKANDTSFEIDNLERIGKSRNNETTEINHGDMMVKVAKTVHGTKVEIRNKENNGFIKIDSFNGKSRIVLSADVLELDGELNAGKGVKGYPVLSESPNTAVVAGGVRLRSAGSGIA